MKIFVRVIMITLGLGAGVFLKTEISIFIKNTKPTLEDFKEFVVQCSKETEKTLLNEVVVDDTIITREKIKEAANNYCVCMTNKVIERKIIKPYYNQYLYSFEEIELENAAKLDKYLSNELGKRDIKACLGQ